MREHYEHWKNLSAPMALGRACRSWRSRRKGHVALMTITAAHPQAGKGRNDRVLTRIRTMCETRVDSWGPVCTVDQTAKDNCVLRCISEVGDCTRPLLRHRSKTALFLPCASPCCATSRSRLRFQDCYKAIYGADPLEDGEIDNRRGPQFRDCASRDLRKPSRAADLEAAQIGF